MTGFTYYKFLLRDGAQAIASKYTLPSHWFNYLTQMLIYDKIIMPKRQVWFLKQGGIPFVRGPVTESASLRKSRDRARFLERYLALSCRGLIAAQPYHEEIPVAQHHHVEGSTRRTRMPVSYTNRKGLTYTLYRGQTKTGKPHYYFGRADQSQGEPARLSF
jgi:hypothetical protein